MSFKNETSFLMTSVKGFKEHQNTNLIYTNKGLDLLKSASIYGSNAAGKSNFIDAMDGMNYVVHNSFRDSLKKESEGQNLPITFKLNTATENEPTMFEVSFLINETIYRYGFEIRGREIMKEWLYRKVEREMLLFYRIKDDFEINNTSFKEGLKFKNEVNPNVLFISHLAQHNQIISSQILNWFSNTNVINSLDDDEYAGYTKRLIKIDNNFRLWISKALKYLEITDVEAGEEKGEIMTYHNLYDENNLLVGSVPFSIDEYESSGTRKLIYLLGPLFDTLRNGKVLFVDEFDVKLHAKLTWNLIRLFNEFNNKNAQLIFTGHDTSIMDKRLVRRDQIWFVRKDQFGVSELYSMADFSSDVVRRDSAYEKKYLDDQFGAADSIELTEELTNLLYG